MQMRNADWLILGKLAVSTLACYIISGWANTVLAPAEGQDQYWLISLFLCLMGYATVFLPGWLIIRHVRDTNYLDLGAGSSIFNGVRLCVKGSEADNIDEEYLAQKNEETPR